MPGKCQVLLGAMERDEQDRIAVLMKLSLFLGLKSRFRLLFKGCKTSVSVWGGEQVLETAWGQLHRSVNIIKATESHTAKRLKWQILCHICFSTCTCTAHTPQTQKAKMSMQCGKWKNRRRDRIMGVHKESSALPRHPVLPMPLSLLCILENRGWDAARTKRFMEEEALEGSEQDWAEEAARTTKSFDKSLLAQRRVLDEGAP